MLNTTIEGVKDFQACELLYQFRHRDSELEVLHARDLLARRFENTLRRTASFFFWKRQDGIIPSYNSLLRRWERLWYPSSMDAYDVAVEQHEVNAGNMSSYATTAAVAILRFYEVFSSPDLGAPIAIDQPFTLTLGKEMRIEGRYDLVLRRGSEHRVVLWSATPKRPPSNWFTFDFAAQRLAYEDRRGREWERINITYSLYDLAGCNSKELVVEPSADDVACLLYWARRLHDTELYVPRRGLTTYCRTCPFDRSCREWSKWPR